MRDDLDFSRPLECDVAVAGAGLSGLVAGAILARNGRRVIVVDRPGLVGGRGGSTPHRGYWLDGGHRDGTDVGDLQVGWRYGQLAETEADVRAPLREVKPAVRVHQLPEEPGGGEASVVTGSWGAKGFMQLAVDAFGCPEPKLPAFAQALAPLAAAQKPARRAALPQRFDAWLECNVHDPDVRQALLTMVSVIYCDHPERVSAGRIMGFFAQPNGLPPVRIAYPDHPTVGGMQGLALPFAEAIEARGGRILTGLAPARVGFDARRANTLVARDESHLALEIRARDVVLATPLWDAVELLPDARVSPELAALARALANEQADAIAWLAGLSRLPRLRATGEPESHVGWNRILIGPERRYSGGFHLPSLGSQAAAPQGKHLLHAFVARWLRTDERPDWDESRAILDRVTSYLRELYLDFDECVEWSAPQWIERPACLAWFWAPIERHGVRVPGCDGVWLAGSTLESDAGPVDICAHAGLEAARAILAEG